MDIVEFLTACINTDEAVAKAAVTGNGEWRMHDHDSDTVIVRDSTGEAVVYNEGWPSDEQARHIADHDPARTLRRVAAYRAILAMYSTGAQFPDFAGGYESAIDDVLCALATEFKDRPGFNPQWSLT